MPNTRPAYATRAGTVSNREAELIEQLRTEQGWGAHRIARELRRHPGTVVGQLIRLGLYPARTGAPRRYLRAGHLVRTWSAEEDAAIEELRIAGLNTRRIGEALATRFGEGRSHSLIYMRLRQLAARDEAADA